MTPCHEKLDIHCKELWGKNKENMSLIDRLMPFSRLTVEATMSWSNLSYQEILLVWC